MAGEVHPVPFRTRKLSPPAPMVLRSKSVGEQDVADQRGAFCCRKTPVDYSIAWRLFVYLPAEVREVLLIRSASLFSSLRSLLGRGSRFLMWPLSPCPPRQDVCKPWSRPPRLAGAAPGAYITSSRRAPSRPAGPATRANLENRIPRSKRSDQLQTALFSGWLASARKRLVDSFPKDR